MILHQGSWYFLYKHHPKPLSSTRKSCFTQQTCVKIRWKCEHPYRIWFVTQRWCHPLVDKGWKCVETPSHALALDHGSNCIECHEFATLLRCCATSQNNSHEENEASMNGGITIYRFKVPRQCLSSWDPDGLITSSWDD